jgi:hypothetical protein
MSTVDLNLRADLSALRGELAKIPGLTEVEAKRMVKTLATNFKSAERATATAAKKINAEMSGALGDIQQGAQVAFGGVVGDLVDVGRAFGGLATAIGPVGLGVAGVAAGAAVGVAGLAMLQRSALASVDALHELGIPVDPAMEASIEQANAAMDALGAGFDLAVVTIGSKFAPVVQQGAELILHFGYKAADAIAAFDDGQVTLEGFARFLTGAFVEALMSPIRTLALFGLGVAELGEALGLNVEHLRRGSQMIMGFADQAKAAVVSNVELDGVLSNLDPRVRKLTDATLRQVQARNDDHKATKKQTESNRELEAALGRWGSLTEQVAAINSSANEDQLDDVGRLQAAAEAQLGDLERIRVAYQQLGEQGVFVSAELTKVDEAQAAVKARLVRDVEALAAVTEDLTSAYTENAAAAQRAGAEVQAWVETNRTWVDGVGQISESVNALVGAATDQVIAASEKQVATAEEDRDRAVSAYDEARTQFEQNVSGMSAADQAAHQAKIERLRAEKREATKTYASVKQKAQEAALAAFETQQAAAYSNAIVQSAVVFMTMIPAFSWAAWGALPLAGAVAAGSLATAVATIASAPRPTFHTGGIVGGAPVRGGSPDEVDTRLTAGEGVLTRRGVATLGGADAVAGLNRGQRSGANGATSVFLNNRVLAQVFADGRVRAQGTSPVIGSRLGMVY